VRSLATILLTPSKTNGSVFKLTPHNNKIRRTTIRFPPNAIAIAYNSISKRLLLALPNKIVSTEVDGSQIKILMVGIKCGQIAVEEKNGLMFCVVRYSKLVYKLQNNDSIRIYRGRVLLWSVVVCPEQKVVIVSSYQKLIQMTYDGKQKKTLPTLKRGYTMFFEPLQSKIYFYDSNTIASFSFRTLKTTTELSFRRKTTVSDFVYYGEQFFVLNSNGQFGAFQHGRYEEILKFVMVTGIKLIVVD